MLLLTPCILIPLVSSTCCQSGVFNLLKFDHSMLWFDRIAKKKKTPYEYPAGFPVLAYETCVHHLVGLNAYSRSVILLRLDALSIVTSSDLPFQLLF